MAKCYDAVSKILDFTGFPAHWISEVTIQFIAFNI